MMESDQNAVATELDQLQASLAARPLPEQNPFADAFSRVQDTSEEAQEMMVYELIELVPDQVDGLADCMANPYTPKLYPGMTLAELSALLDQHYGWTQAVDLADPAAQTHFWYVSEEKLEPRLGNRHCEDGAEREMPFNIPLYSDQLRRAITLATYSFPAENEPRQRLVL